MNTDERPTSRRSYKPIKTSASSRRARAQSRIVVRVPVTHKCKSSPAYEREVQRCHQLICMLWRRGMSFSKIARIVRCGRKRVREHRIEFRHYVVLCKALGMILPDLNYFVDHNGGKDFDEAVKRL